MLELLRSPLGGDADGDKLPVVFMPGDTLDDDLAGLLLKTGLWVAVAGSGGGTDTMAGAGGGGTIGRGGGTLW